MLLLQLLMASSLAVLRKKLVDCWLWLVDGGGGQNSRLLVRPTGNFVSGTKAAILTGGFVLIVGLKYWW